MNDDNINEVKKRKLILSEKMKEEIKEYAKKLAYPIDKDAFDDHNHIKNPSI
ncbi:MAG: hypothetical protein LBD57_04180 [Endomicrobium sp.]|jgi:hypothetical protein|uniref:hypothetical protein n=1 Tax=Candidatus Endomicrobiellum cubanum TaxID=3242325 RepID=UPI002816EC13|nr:hypothetical protein [Endomicrobium sp.]